MWAGVIFRFPHTVDGIDTFAPVGLEALAHYVLPFCKVSNSHLVPDLHLGFTLQWLVLEGQSLLLLLIQLTQFGVAYFPQLVRGVVAVSVGRVSLFTRLPQLDVDVGLVVVVFHVALHQIEPVFASGRGQVFLQTGLERLVEAFYMGLAVAPVWNSEQLPNIHLFQACPKVLLKLGSVVCHNDFGLQSRLAQDVLEVGEDVLTSLVVQDTSPALACRHINDAQNRLFGFDTRIHLRLDNQVGLDTSKLLLLQYGLDRQRLLGHITVALLCLLLLEEILVHLIFADAGHGAWCLGLGFLHVVPHLVSSSKSAIKVVDVLQFLVLLVGEWLDHSPFVFATPILTFACLVVATVLVLAVAGHYLLPFH